ncbi:MAG: L,D-transpeptidase family protein [Pirellula sp.]|nr:L,D-transpeptidase family protein [Pirellula sp.]
MKTALVVVLLLFVIYGAFVAINGSNTALNPEIADLVDLDTNTPDIGGVTGPFLSNSTPPAAGAAAPGADAWAQFQSKPAAGFNSPAPATNEPAFGATPPALPTLPENGGTSIAASLDSNKNSSSNLPPLDTSDLPPLPPLPPIISADNMAKDASDSASTKSVTSLPPLPAASPESPRGTATTDLAANSNATKTQTPDFGLAIPSSPNGAGSSKQSQDSPSLSAASNLPSTDLLPKLPNADSKLNEPRPPAGNTIAVTSKAYENAKTVASDQAAKGQLKDALATLSVFYSSAELSETQRTDLVDFLDALAAQVIYSTEHYLDLPYTAAAGESLDQIARRYQIPTEVLARINGLEPTAAINAGTKLKVIPGPFRAEVDLNRNELTLFLGELYASRFPISTGSDPNPQPGSYSVVAKDRNRNYYGGGAPIMATDANNPYGGYLIDLGNQISIHGSSTSSNDKLGCISLSPADVADVYGMLSSGSQVTIKR